MKRDSMAMLVAVGVLLLFGTRQRELMRERLVWFQSIRGIGIPVPMWVTSDFNVLAYMEDNFTLDGGFFPADRARGASSMDGWAGPIDDWSEFWRTEYPAWAQRVRTVPK